MRGSALPDFSARQLEAVLALVEYGSFVAAAASMVRRMRESVGSATIGWSARSDRPSLRRPASLWRADITTEKVSRPNGEPTAKSGSSST